MTPLMGGTAVEVLPESTRWSRLAAGCVMMTCAGGIYAFGVWSEELAARWPSEMSDKVTTLNALYETTLMGVYLPFAGFFCHQFGTRATLLVASALMTVGYSGLLLQFFSSDEPTRPNLLTYALFFAAGLSTGFIDVAVIPSNLGTFHTDQRPAIVGLLKGYFGVAAGVLGLVHATGIDTESFLIVLGPISGFLVLWGFSQSKEGKVKEGHALYWKLKFSLAAQAIIAVFIFMRSTLDPTSTTLAVVLCVCVLPLTLSSYASNHVYRLCSSLSSDYALLEGDRATSDGDLAGNFSAGVDDAQQSQQDTDVSVLSAPAPVSGDPVPILDQGNHLNPRLSTSEETLQNGEVAFADATSVKFSTGMKSPSFWFLFTQLMIIYGAGLLVISNAARIMKAKGGDVANISSLVSFVSTFNCLGRTAVGFVASHPMAKALGLYPPVLLCIVLLVMAGAQLMLAYTGPGLTLVAGCMVGFAYGAAWALHPIILTNLFGLEFYGQLYGVMGLAPALGSFLCSVLAATVYAAHATHDPSAGDQCSGNACYGEAHLITSACCMAAAVLLGPCLARAAAARRSLLATA